MPASTQLTERLVKGGFRMAGADPSTRRRFVLIVDDNAQVRQLLVDYAATIGREALEAENGLQALWIVKQQRPELVLLDLKMPRLGGYEAVRHIQKFDPGIRIVVITGDQSDETRREVERLGLELLEKPFDFHRLDRILHGAALAS
jgi:CheY-like chemotaxis protein